jgi:hypothetical protein
MKLVLGIVIDEDSKYTNTDKTSYDILGFALLDLDTLFLSFVEKDGSTDKFKHDISIIASSLKIYEKYKKYIIPNGRLINRGYLLSSIVDGIESQDIPSRCESLPIYTKKLDLFTVVGAETMRFNLYPHGSLTYNCRSNKLDVYVKDTCDSFTWLSYLSDTNHKINIKTLSMVSSPFDDTYVYGDCCWIVNCFSKSVVVPENIKSLVVYSSKIGDLVLPKSLEYIYIVSISHSPIKTYYLSKDAKLSLVCLLINILSNDSGEDGKNTYFLFEEEASSLFDRKDYEKIWEICHEDRFKSYLDRVLSQANIVVY